MTRAVTSKKLLHDNKEVSLCNADVWKGEIVVTAGVKDSKVVIITHNAETDKKEVRDFYDFPSHAGSVPNVRVQQCDSPKIITSSCGLNLYDFESGEPIASWNPNKNMAQLHRDPNSIDLFYVRDSGGNEIMQYDLRVKDKPVGYYTTKFGYIKNMFMGAYPGSKLLVISTDKVSIFDPASRKLELTIEVPENETYFKNAAQYANVLAVQWSKCSQGRLLLFDLNNLKGTAPKYEPTKTITSPGAFENHAGDPGYIMHWQATPEGVFTNHCSLYQLPFS